MVWLLWTQDGVQHPSTKEKRSPAYLCQRGQQQDGQDTNLPKYDRPARGCGIAAYLPRSVSPLGVEVAAGVLEQQSNSSWLSGANRSCNSSKRATRHGWRQERCAVDPDNRLSLPSCAPLQCAVHPRSRVRARRCQSGARSSLTLTTEERAAMQTLAQDLSTIWHAQTTTPT